VLFVYAFYKLFPEVQCHGRRYIAHQMEYVGLDDWPFGEYARKAAIVWEYEATQVGRWRGATVRHVRASGRGVRSLCSTACAWADDDSVPVSLIVCVQHPPCYHPAMEYRLDGFPAPARRSDDARKYHVYFPGAMTQGRSEQFDTMMTVQSVFDIAVSRRAAALQQHWQLSARAVRRHMRCQCLRHGIASMLPM
jgi:hypothetical protein